MVEHKIQSSGSGSSGLTLQLENVPKLLGRVTHDWAPNAFVISFKLETDPTLVIPKAQRAIENYGVHLVVANQLQVSIVIRSEVAHNYDKTNRHEEMYCI